MLTAARRTKILIVMALAILVVLVIVLVKCSAKLPSPPAAGDPLPPLPAESQAPAPEDPTDARHLTVHLNVTADGPAVNGPVTVAAGWPSGYPGGGSDVQVQLLDRDAKPIWQVDMPNPLFIRVYGSATPGGTPHGTQQQERIAVDVVLPLLPTARTRLVGKLGQVVEVRDLKE
jgi:hypothetical protein